MEKETLQSSFPELLRITMRVYSRIPTIVIISSGRPMQIPRISLVSEISSNCSFPF